jgi:hypothetical protein
MLDKGRSSEMDTIFLNQRIQENSGIVSNRFTEFRQRGQHSLLVIRSLSPSVLWVGKLAMPPVHFIQCLSRFMYIEMQVQSEW